MNVLKSIDKYYEMTQVRLKPNTVSIHSYIVTALKTALNDLSINDFKQIDYNTGFAIISSLKSFGYERACFINRVLMYLKKVMRSNDIGSSFYRFENLKKDTVPFQRFYSIELKKIMHYIMSLDNSKNSCVYRALILLLLDSGVRISEALNIKISNIDFDSNPMRIFLQKTKTGKNRYAPFSNFSKDFIYDLAQNKDNNGFLFWNYIRKRQLSKQDVKLFYRRMGKKLDIENIHSHRFRKTFASKIVENGMPIEMLQQLFGHSRISTTMIYVQYLESKALDSYNKFNEWKY